MREYAAATGAGPVPDRGAAVAPPTFAACFTIARLGEVVADPELGAHWNLVHSSQSYDFHRPVVVGDVLACTPQITDIQDRRRMEIMTLEIDCLDDDDGSPVVTSRAAIIFFPPRAATAGTEVR